MRLVTYYLPSYGLQWNFHLRFSQRSRNWFCILVFSDKIKRCKSHFEFWDKLVLTIMKCIAVLIEANALFHKTEASKKIKKDARPKDIQSTLKPSTSPAIQHLCNGHQRCSVELAQRTNMMQLPLVLQNRFASLQTVDCEDRRATCRVSVV
ncbi:hypothetical protein Bca4012_061031 [Brassica carinata]